jgi:hypothetical protein
MGTVSRLDIILGGATDALFHEFSTGHGHKMPSLPLNHFQITDDEFPIKRDRTECTQPVIKVGDQFDANFGNLHGDA